MTHLCPCGCGSQVDGRLLACKAGWFRLPSPLRGAVTVAYRRWLKDRTNLGLAAAHQHAVDAAGRWYTDHPAEGA